MLCQPNPISISLLHSPPPPSLPLARPFLPDRPFLIFRVSKSTDWRTLRSSETLIFGFEGPKIIERVGRVSLQVRAGLFFARCPKCRRDRAGWARKKTGNCHWLRWFSPLLLLALSLSFPPSFSTCWQLLWFSFSSFTPQRALVFNNQVLPRRSWPSIL